MKTIYNILTAACLILLPALTACQDDYAQTNQGDAPLVLSASEQTLALDITAPQSTAITFEWTPGSNFNTNAAITYTFEMALQGSGLAENISVELTRGTASVAYKTSELNDILLDQFGILPAQEATLEARVTAQVHHEGIDPQISQVVTVTATPYRPVSNTLYIIGGAAPNGWSADEATPMNNVTGAAGGFVWQGKLNAGELKFITTPGSFEPSYNKGDDDTHLYFRESTDDPYDEKFVIPTAGIYRITLNIINLTILIEALEAPEYTELWFVGNPTGWSFVPMTADASDPFIFRYNADLSAGGEFKIGTMENNWDAAFFRPVVDATPEGMDMDVDKWAGDPDYKWNISGGVYKIKLDTRDMKIDIAPFNPFAMIYLVGDATPNGWDVGNATPMRAGSDPYTFVWTGTLSAGELKFSCDKQSDWNGGWFLAGEDGIEPTGDTEQMMFSPVGSNPDNKWKINTAGTYTIELDQLQETVRMIRN